MTQQGVRWTAEQVLALAPDASSRKAGSRLGSDGPWSAAGTSGDAVWGLCKGSGSKPYQTVVALSGPGAGAGPGYKCSCPSRKFPCKHALGLLLLWSADSPTVGNGEPPEWAGQWLAGRTERAEKKAAGTATARSADPAAAERRAARRAERIAAGACDLEQRLTDLIRGGIAGADRAGYAAWNEAAARMVDAQAPGLASRVRELGAVASSGDGWPQRMLEECSLLHLLGQGYVNAEQLSEPMRATVRGRVGVTTEAAELLRDPGARVRDRWLVLAQRDSEEGKLTVRRSWLWGRESARAAQLVAFGAAGRAPELSLPTGLALDAELAYYPGARALRAALGEQFAPPVPGERPPGTDVASALTAYGQALCDDPWLEAWPAVLTDVVPIPGADGWQLADAAQPVESPVGAGGPAAPAGAAERAALPVDPRSPAAGLWRLASVAGGRPVTVFGECGHRGFTPLTVWVPGEDEAVPL